MLGSLVGAYTQVAADNVRRRRMALVLAAVQAGPGTAHDLAEHISAVRPWTTERELREALGELVNDGRITSTGRWYTRPTYTLRKR